MPMLTARRPSAPSTALITCRSRWQSSFWGDGEQGGAQQGGSGRNCRGTKLFGCLRLSSTTLGRREGTAAAPGAAARWPPCAPGCRARAYGTAVAWRSGGPQGAPRSPLSPRPAPPSSREGDQTLSPAGSAAARSTCQIDQRMGEGRGEWQGGEGWRRDGRGEESGEWRRGKGKGEGSGG